ncbi:MAG: hypothetical protein SH856_00720 [Flavobacteriales bacterium]|nr:hypothetical protein [Flavobacteriales bacterium]
MLFAFCILACKKKEEDPAAPVIEFKSISANEVEQFNNTVSITFSYEDFQGDLGEQDPDDYSLSVKDSRLENADWFHVPPMTPDMQELHIKGEYSLELPALFLLGNGSQEAAKFTLQLTDRAGNKSNTIVSPEVLVVDSL